MKFPSGFDHEATRSSSDEPDVTTGVLERLGMSDDASAGSPAGTHAMRQVRRFKFVVVLGGIVLASVLWRSLSPSGESIELVEQFPQTIQDGREHRAQLLMGFMAPFEKFDQAIPTVGVMPDTGSNRAESFPGLPEVDSGPVEAGGSSPSEVDILDATAPFPSS